MENSTTEIIKNFEIVNAIINGYNKYHNTKYDIMLGEYDDYDYVYEVNLLDRTVVDRYKSYEQVIIAWKPSIIGDMYELGTEDKDGEWNFYLTKEQLDIVLAMPNEY